MADINDICEGVAANLTVLLNDDVVKTVVPWIDDNPTMPSVQIGGVQTMTRSSFGDSWTILLLVQALIGRASDQHSQKLLNRLVAGDGITSVWDAIESNRTLTSRYNPADGLSTNQPAAADDVAVVSFDGAAKFTNANGVDALVGTWTVQVLA